MVMSMADSFDGPNNDHTRAIGKIGEDLAAARLEQQGYEILERNVHASHYGEIDLIAREADDLVFVEVKLRRSLDAGYPEEAVTQKKLQHLIKAAQWYVTRHGCGDHPWRIDVVGLVESQGEITYFNLIQNVTIW